MRKVLIEEAVARLVANDSGDPDTRLARQLMVERFGPECAAWLVRDRKRALRKAGAFDVIVDAGVEPRPWFDIAIDFLRERRDWSVDVQTHQGLRRFRVRWHAWGRYAPRREEVVRGR